MGATLTTVLQRKLGGYEYRVSENRKWEVMSTEFRKTGRCHVVHICSTYCRSASSNNILKSTL